MNKFPPGEKYTWGRRAQRLRVCCNTKPDLLNLGWVKLTGDKFKSKFQNRDELFLKQMFEKHYGETIEVRRHEKGITKNPWSVNMHHPQLFVNSHRDERQRRARKDAVTVFGKGGVDPNRRSRINQFVTRMADVESAAFTPRGAVMCFRCLVRMEGSCKHGLFSF